MSSPRAEASGRAQSVGQRLDGVEHPRDLAFVEGQHHALGEHFGDQLQALLGGIGQADRAGQVHAFIAVGAEQEIRILLFGTVDGPADLRRELREEGDLLHRLQFEQHHRAVAEQHRATLTAGPHQQRRLGDASAAFEGTHVDALADEQRAGVQAGVVRKQAAGHGAGMMRQFPEVEQSPPPASTHPSRPV